MKSWFFSLLCALFFISTYAKKGFGPTEQEWRFVTVREGAHMFWWFHQTSNTDVSSYTDLPVVIWLQGGPGASSTGFGNFGELGPLDSDLNPRNSTWLRTANVLFVDNPVGTGYSYVDSIDKLAKTNQQIGEDFVAVLKDFYDTLPQLKNSSLYIFSESYGGKMTVDIALAVDKAIKSGELDVDLKGVGLGDSWISPIDSVLTWGPYLLNVGAVDQNGYEQIMESANLTAQAIAEGNWQEATELWGMTEGTVMSVANVDFYNILTKTISYGGKRLLKRPYKLFKPSTRDIEDDKINDLMNNEVREALGINKTWGGQSGVVFSALRGDFMKPVTEGVELLLNTTDILVAVYNGQLDLIVDTPGTVAWVDRLKFQDSEKWKTADRQPMAVNLILEGYYKKLGNLRMYWVNRAGHMVPSDNPTAMTYILDNIIAG